ncbi:MAG: hypothetical protein V1781_07700 [Bacteroidota bacterium]
MYKSDYQILLEKLDEFIRKYYKNHLIRGVLYSTGMMLLFYLSVTIPEYFGHFNTTVRTVLFYLFVFTNCCILAKFIIIPLSKLNKLGKIISNEQAAQIIGKHFSNVQDKLLNVLQLKNLQSANLPFPQSAILIEASINQKIKELRLIPFSAAIDLWQNKKYFKYALIPLLLFTFVFLSNSNILTESTNRLLNHRTYFEKEAPFQFIIQNKEMKIPQLDDFTLIMKVAGTEIPEEVFIEINNSEYKLAKENKTIFNFLFRNVQKNIPFRFSADGFVSKEYKLIVLPKPILLDFNILLNYPKYIGKKDETIKNTGDMVLPVGTKVTWNFNTQNAKQLKMHLSDTTFSVLLVDENKFSCSQIFMHDQSYSVSSSNEFLQNRDSLTYSVNIIPDLFPAIQVEEKKDSVLLKQIYFMGNIKDDYGFNHLTFISRFLNKKDSSLINTQIVPISKSITQQSFYYFWDMSVMNIAPSDEIEYYFEVWDNDGVNGSKAARTQHLIYRAPSKKEITESASQKNTRIKNEIDESIQQAKALQKELDDIYKKILDKKNLSWEEKKKMEDLIQKQKELQERIEKIKNENSNNNQMQSEFLKPDENIVEKQKQLQELFNNVMTEDMKKIFEEMQKLIEKLDKNKIQEQLEKMKLSNKDIEKELDRTLEIFKQIEFEQKMEQTIEQLKELAKEQDKLSQKSEEKNFGEKKDEIKQKQDLLNKDFQDIRKSIDELEKKNNELEQPNPMQNTEQKEQEIQQEQQNSSQQLNEGKNKKASQSQKNASQKMNQLSRQMQEMMEQMNSEQQEEDERALRDILNNLIQLSFDQEALMKETNKVKSENPQYVKHTQQQKKLKDDAAMIEDSLLALSKRQASIQSVVNREISAINMNMDKSIYLMSKRDNHFSPDISSRQQFSMTSINNLALLLSETLNQMQNNCKSSKSGQCSKPGSCKKPGHGKKPSFSSMRQMQEELNKRIRELKKSLEKGQNPNGQKQGNQQGTGSMSEELVKIAAQQEALKQMMMQMMKEGGMAPGDAKNTLKMMEETQKDMVNKMLNEKTIIRQQQILEKLLDYEKAERERDTEQKRQAKEARDEPKRNLSEFMEYNMRKKKRNRIIKNYSSFFQKFLQEQSI